MKNKKDIDVVEDIIKYYKNIENNNIYNIPIDKIREICQWRILVYLMFE